MKYKNYYFTLFLQEAHSILIEMHSEIFWKTDSCNVNINSLCWQGHGPTCKTGKKVKIELDCSEVTQYQQWVNKTSESTEQNGKKSIQEILM